MKRRNDSNSWVSSIRNAPTHAGLIDVLANAGLRLRVSDRGTLLMSLGRYLRDEIGAHRTAVGYIGWQMTL